jgi:hypothetical protein
VQLPVNKARIIKIAGGVLVMVCLYIGGIAQELPKKIRGYKLHRVDVSVNKENRGSGIRVDVGFGEPRVTSFSLEGLTFELDSTVLVYGKSGKVDFLMFRDFTVNGIDVEINEYRKSFDFEKDASVKLENPVSITVGASGVLKGAFSEMRSVKKQWDVKGRLFVFGKFKKFGFTFKRVVPVDLELSIKNPVTEKLRSGKFHRKVSGDSGIIEQQRYIRFNRFAGADFGHM